MSKRFTNSHEWITIEGSHGTVGVTHYAQKELGEVVYAQLPQVGQSVHLGEAVCVLESTKAAADVYSPMSGKVTAVNDAVAAKPQLINQAPESDAWLFRLDLSKPDEAKDLLSKAAYEAMIGG